MLKKLIFLSGVLIFYLVSVDGQVNMQTGSATFTLPMFNWHDNKSRLSSVINLSYNSGNGLKVSDVASDVGEGWNLEAGGVILRMQVGQPDDQRAYFNPNNGSELDNDITKYPAGYLYAPVSPQNGCPNALINYPLYGSMNQIYTQHNIIAEDRELDYFSFQFNGKIGMFILDTIGGDHGVPLNDTKLKITFTLDTTMATNDTNGIRTTITSFSIQDVDGLIYKFTAHGLSKVLESDFSDKSFTYKLTQPTFKSNGVYEQAGLVNSNYINPYVITSWYLSEIDDPLTQRKIIFNYGTLNINNSAGEEISYNQWHDYIMISHNSTIAKIPQLQSIYYPDGHLVNFNYGAQRVDLNGDQVLTSVDISYNGRYLSEYQLKTSYFIKNRYGTPISAYQKRMARLCLMSVKKIGVDLKEDSPPYLFDYYLGSDSADDIVPPPFSYSKDIWGYYNGYNSVPYDYPSNPNEVPVPYDSYITSLNYLQLRGLCFLNSSVSGIYLNPKSGYAKNGLLRQIFLPTGGTLTYQYAQNMGTLPGGTGDVMVGGVHVSQTTSTDGGYSNGCSNPIISNFNYVKNGVGSPSSLWGLEMPVNYIITGSHYAAEYKAWHWVLSNCGLFGCCYWHYLYPGILNSSQTASQNMGRFENMLASIAPELGVANVAGTAADILTFSNFLGPEMLAMDFIANAVTLIVSCEKPTKDGSTYIYFNSNLNDANPLPSEYNRVEVVENPGTIGKTVYRFTDSSDYPLWVLSNPDFSLQQRFAPWAYGLPKLTTQYDVNGNIVKQTQDVYNFQHAQELIDGFYKDPFPTGIYSPWVSCKCQVNLSVSQRSSYWSNISLYNAPSSYSLTSLINNTYNYSPSIANLMDVDFYGFNTGRVELDSVYERAYSTVNHSQYLQNIKVYTYNTLNNYEVNQIETIQSNGDINYKNIKYSSDYTGGALTTLVQNNIVADPVETTVSVVKATGSQPTEYLSENVTEFTQVATGAILPSRILEQRFAQPVQAANMSFYQGPGSNISNYKIPETFTYDGNGNLIGLQDEGEREVTNIYDYNDKYITATVINADPVLDKSAYSSFESGDLSRSGWQLNGPAIYDTDALAPTGNIVLTLLPSMGNKLTSDSLNTTKAYILSFWASNGNVSVSGGASLVKSAPTINGFTYYEYNVAQGTSIVAVSNSSSSNVNIDELRLYPSTARMRTMTYDPLIGKTSQCDENNRITYYTYDSLGRLQFLEDEYRNIIKMNEYNNVSASKQNGCPGTYTNALISETFSKSNCGAGYQGSNITYSVAANTYHSALSQSDADIQAENDILDNGQNNADANGSCALIYYNAAQSQTDSSQTCAEGYVGGGVTYTVPAGKYSSIISQADADQQAINEIAANAQAYTNAHPVCVINTSPDWTWLETSPTYCSSVNGDTPAHLIVFETDLNPNSPTYNQTRWSDVGPQDACPANTYYNASQSGNFTKNNCSGDSTGSTVTYTVAPGIYNSTVSQAAADQQATNDINTNGQNYANANGSCIVNANISYANSRAFQYDVQFTNNSNSQVYNFTANANTTGSLGVVPAGVYTVYICPVNNYTNNNNYDVLGYYLTSVICGTFDNISVTSSGGSITFY